MFSKESSVNQIADASLIKSNSGVQLQNGGNSSQIFQVMQLKKDNSRQYHIPHKVSSERLLNTNRSRQKLQSSRRGDRFSSSPYKSPLP